MARTIIFEKAGGPEVLKLVDREVGEPGPGEVRIRQEAVGVNFIDCYHRSGLYPLPLPHSLGVDGAGVIEAVGAGVTHLRPGDRAAYVSQPPGSYTEARVMSAQNVAPLPDGVSATDAAAVMLKGMTVEFLMRRTTPLTAGDTILWHAAAGGVGLIACQWARSEGIRLIGTAGTDEKCRIAEENGADVCINYRSEDFAARVRELTGGAGVSTVMDSVGKETFEGSLKCLSPQGLLISFGNASGPVPPFEIGRLGPMGNLMITRPTLFAHLRSHEIAQEMAGNVFAKVESGAVKPAVWKTYPLEEAGEAHRALESRATSGSLVLTM